MTCNKCNAESLNKFGKDRKGHQRFRCPKCGKTFTEPHNGNFASMYTPTEKAAAIIKLLVEGVSVRSIERLTDTHRDTILRVLVLVNAGERCEQLLEDRIQGVAVKDVQCDEMWGSAVKKNGISLITRNAAMLIALLQLKDTAN